METFCICGGSDNPYIGGQKNYMIICEAKYTLDDSKSSDEHINKAIEPFKYINENIDVSIFKNLDKDLYEQYQNAIIKQQLIIKKLTDQSDGEIKIPEDILTIKKDKDKILDEIINKIEPSKKSRSTKRNVINRYDKKEEALKLISLFMIPNSPEQEPEQEHSHKNDEIQKIVDKYYSNRELISLFEQYIEKKIELIYKLSSILSNS